MPELLSDQPEIEYLDGAAHRKVSPKLSHGIVQRILSAIIADIAGDRGIVATELRCHPGSTGGRPTSFVPDISYVAFERLKAVPKAAREEPPFAPDIAVEVRSPSDNLRYLRKKIERYLQTGALLALDVNPATRKIAVHDGTNVREFSEGEIFEHPAFPWLRFAVHNVFSKLDLID